jgi:hypothetical protein
MFKLYVIPNSEDILKEFFTVFFQSKHIIKIGYGIIGDLKIFMGMFGYMKELVKNSAKLVDLAEVTQPIMDHPHILPLVSSNCTVEERVIITLLVERTLHLKLYVIACWKVLECISEHVVLML